MTVQERAALQEELAAEPLSPEDVEAINEGIRQAKAGMAMPLDEVMARLKKKLDRA